jgi:hypothetical protein
MAFSYSVDGPRLRHEERQSKVARAQKVLAWLQGRTRAWCMAVDVHVAGHFNLVTGNCDPEKSEKLSCPRK